MIPILYPYSETLYSNRGYGSLSDCQNCIITEELNGGYTLEMTYPGDGVNSEYLVPRNIIYVQPNHVSASQPFRIYKVSKSLVNQYKIYANHISYDLTGYEVTPFTAASLATAITTLSGLSSPFTLSTNMSSASAFTVDVPSSVRSWFGGKEGSLIDIYGGEWKYDKFMCTLMSQRGSDNGVRISYGANLADYQKVRQDNVYSHVLAYYAKEVNGSMTVVYGDAAPTGLTSIQRTLILDVTNDYEDTIPTSAQLTTLASTYASSNHSSLIADSQTITVKPELVGLQYIGMGDTVHVTYDGETISTRVVKTVWDALGERYTSIELGTKKTSITETIKSVTASGTSTTKGDNLVTYTITYTSNSYFNATNTARVALHRYGKVGMLSLNLAPSTSIPASTALFEIGSFDCTFTTTINVNVPGQNNASCSLLYSISSSGVIKVGNYSSSASGTNFYRAVVPVIFAD